ncbi:hypothetical protein FOMG_19350 [Fusarium oxysporum f. sp. melonis 26406]|uniref:Uncharacterized protein n=1 Tax=Fusarium oxysporum f. sp. melonis 26406 TaxID=1089452 RepID=W9YXJ9_FUSOX|nr:hypothetical protein FOMG_19350 [Fusarium oxysporum f. sp. melonis 26406]
MSRTGMVLFIRMETTFFWASSKLGRQLLANSSQARSKPVLS